MRRDNEKFAADRESSQRELHEISHRIPELQWRIRNAEDELRGIRGSGLEYELRRVTTFKADRETENSAMEAHLRDLEDELARVKDKNNQMELNLEERDTELRTLEGDIQNQQQVADENQKESREISIKIREEENKSRALDSKHRE